MALDFPQKGLLLVLIMLQLTFAQYNYVYVNNSYTGSPSGTKEAPYITLAQALASLESVGSPAIIYLAPTATSYTLEGNTTLSEDYDLRIMLGDDELNSTELNSLEDCSKLPVISISQASLSLGSITFGLITFKVANQPILLLNVTDSDFQNICYNVNMNFNSGISKSPIQVFRRKTADASGGIHIFNNILLSIQDNTPDVKDIAAIQVYTADNNDNNYLANNFWVYLYNWQIFATGTSTPRTFIGKGIGSISITNLTSNSIPQMSVTTEIALIQNLYMKGLTMESNNCRNASGVIMLNFTTLASFENVTITSFELTDISPLMYIYQINTNFTKPQLVIDGFNFSKNSFYLTKTLNTIKFNSFPTVQPNPKQTINNIVIAQNTISFNSINSQFEVFLFNLTNTQNQYFENWNIDSNQDFKILYSTGKVNAESRLNLFKNCSFTNNYWDSGSLPVINIIGKKMPPSSIEDQPSDVIENLVITDNVIQNNFFSYHNNEPKGNEVNKYLRPRVALQDISLVRNKILNARVFIIDGQLLDFSQSSIENNTFSSAVYLQSTYGLVSAQISSISLTNSNFINSALIIKKVDCTEITSKFNSEDQNVTVAIPYSVLITDIQATDITLSKGTNLFWISGVPNLFLINSTFKNMQLQDSSYLLYSREFLNLNPKVTFHDSVLLEYESYLEAIQNANLTKAFHQSLPFPNDTENQLNHLENHIIYIYRSYKNHYSNIILSQSSLFNVMDLNLQQSAYSFDMSTVENVTIQEYRDKMISLSNDITGSFSDNNITLTQGLGSLLVTSGAENVIITNNVILDHLGSSLFRTVMIRNILIEIANNYGYNITSRSTFIMINIRFNDGYLIFSNNSFSNLQFLSAEDAFREINFISIDTEATDTLADDIPDIYFKDNKFSNGLILKDHPLTKEYDSSFIFIGSSEDLIGFENTIFDNITVLYDDNVLTLISQDIELNNLSVIDTYNNGVYGSVYLLSFNILVNNSKFIRNQAPHGTGAALYIDYDQGASIIQKITLDNNYFVNNTALEGSVIYYLLGELLLSATNNYLENNIGSAETGSVMYFFGCKIQGFYLKNTTFLYSDKQSNAINVFDFTRIEVSNPSTRLGIQDLYVTLNHGFVGTIFKIQDSHLFFSLYNINVRDTIPSQQDMHKFSLITAQSGIINIENSSISHIASNLNSFIEFSCSRWDVSFSINNTQFRDMSVWENVLNLETNQRSGQNALIHVSNEGANSTCLQTLIVENTLIDGLNVYNTTIMGDPSSAILIDYQGQFTLRVLNSEFRNIYAMSGAAVKLFDGLSNEDYLDYIEIRNNKFLNITSELEGGAIYSQNHSLHATGNIFNGTRSMTKSGAAIFSYMSIDLLEMLQKNTFMNTIRYALYSFRRDEPIGSRPTRLIPTFMFENGTGANLITNDDGSFYLINASTYTFQELNISVKLVDQLNQTVYDGYFTNHGSKGVRIYAGDSYQDSRFCDYYGCYLLRPKLLLKGKADDIINMTISYKSIPEFSVPDIHFTAKLRECVPGELNKTSLCIPCSAGTFSFNTSNPTCHQCPPDSANCLGGSRIEVYPGKWRPNTTTVLILDCRMKEVCLGGYDSQCKTGYTGPLCDCCDVKNGYVQTTTGCSSCGNSFFSFIYATAYVFITILFQLWFVKLVRVSNTFSAVTNNDIQSNPGVQIKIKEAMYLRLLITYSQVISLLMHIELDLTPLFKWLELFTTIVANPSVNIFYSLSCSLLDFNFDPDHLLYYRVSFVIFLPVLKILIICLGRIIYWRFRINKKRWILLKVTILCMFVIEQPSVVRELISYLSCVSLDPSNPDQTFVSSDLTYQCNTPLYMSFKQYYVIPSVIFYGILLPVILFIILFVNREKLATTELRVAYGSLYNEYKEQNYYWGIVVIFIKIIIMLLASVLYDDPKTQTLTIFVLIYSYYAIFARIQPYFDKDLYHAEKRTLECFLITIFAFIYYHNNIIETLQWITVSVVALFNIYVILLIISGVIRNALIKVQDRFDPMIPRFKPREVQLDLDFSSDNLHYSFEEQRQKSGKKYKEVLLEDVEDLLFGKDDDLNELSSIDTSKMHNI